jgi:hypothetical protein
MKSRQMLWSAVFTASMATAAAASASVVTVSALSGPWDPTIPGNLAYDNGAHASATTLAVNPGDNITITYLSGLTSAFSDLSPSVDASGYVGGVFGSGTDCAGSPCSGIGATGHPFPSYYIDPTNSGPQIALNALIGAFVDASGVVLLAFATGNGPFSIVAPAGSVALQLGMNDDFFPDNTGALLVDVTGSTAVPQPASWTIMLAALAGFGLAKRNSRR